MSAFKERCMGEKGKKSRVSKGFEEIKGKKTYRPDLSVGGQLVGDTVDREEQTLQVGKLSGGESEQSGVGIVDSTSGLGVTSEGVGSNEDEGGTGINDTSRTGLDGGRGTVTDGLSDTPELRSRRGGSHGTANLMLKI